jgi:chromate reductase
VRILGISGSLRAGSHNTQLLQAAAELLPDGFELELWDGLKTVPPYDADDDVPGRTPEAVTRLREVLAGADGCLFATPEYNSSVPGQLKNALDWASRPLATNSLRNTPAAVVGASTGAFGAVWSQAELRKVLAAIGARVIDDGVAVGHAPSKFDESGRLVDDDIREQLGVVVGELATAIRERAVTMRPAAA